MQFENLPNESNTPEKNDDLSRREVTQRAGKFLAYTAPALIALMTAKDAGATS